MTQAFSGLEVGRLRGGAAGTAEPPHQVQGTTSLNNLTAWAVGLTLRMASRW